MPLATEVISGERADDPVSLPIIARVREGLKKKGLLYVGDCKMAALQTRAMIQFQQDFYVCPLSLNQVSSEEIRQKVYEVRKKETALQSVERLNEKNEMVCIAQGYEIAQELMTEVNGEMHIWTECRFLIQSTSGLQAATQGLRERLHKAEQAIQAISVRKQGKMRLKTREEVEKAIQEALKKFQVQELLAVTIHEEFQEKKVRVSKEKRAEPHREVFFTLSTERREEAIEYAISHMKWRLYANNQEKGQSTLEQAIEAYRDEYRIERNFERFKGHPFSIAPLSVQRDDHRIGLARLLTIALRVLTLLEGIVGLYAGNPKRRTNQPTTERLLEAFENITFTVIRAADGIQRHATPLSLLQQEILLLLGLMPVISSQLADDS
jgi:transposase